MFRIRPYFIFSEIKFEPFRKKNSTPNEYILPIGLSMCMNPAVGERERERERNRKRERDGERETCYLAGSDCERNRNKSTKVKGPILQFGIGSLSFRKAL
jgi:hypothetical protein